MTAPTQPQSEAAANTDSELWREREGDYYADSIHVTKNGSIGMNVGGSVFVMPIREWHSLATAARVANDTNNQLTEELVTQTRAAQNEIERLRSALADMVKGTMKTPKTLDAIADKVLTYRPKPRSKPARKRQRRKKKIDRG